jgi:hypothetical protein
MKAKRDEKNSVGLLPLLRRQQFYEITVYIVKKVSNFPVRSRDVTNQTLSGGE